jgi:hypothetical protein
VGRPRRDLRGSHKHVGRRRSRAIRRRAIAELPVGIFTPATNPAARRGRAGVKGARGNGLRIREHIARRWAETLGGRAVAELAKAVAAPAANTARVHQRAGVERTRGDVFDSRQDVASRRAHARAGRAIAKLAVGVSAPGTKTARRQQGASEAGAYCQRLHPSQHVVSRWGPNITRGAVAHLAATIVAPAPDTARGQQRASVMARADGGEGFDLGQLAARCPTAAGSWHIVGCDRAVSAHGNIGVTDLGRDSSAVVAGRSGFTILRTSRSAGTGSATLAGAAVRARRAAGPEYATGADGRIWDLGIGQAPCPVGARRSIACNGGAAEPRASAATRTALTGAPTRAGQAAGAEVAP